MVKHVNVFKAVVNYNNIVDPHQPHAPEISEREITIIADEEEDAMEVLEEMSLDDQFISLTKLQDKALVYFKD